MDPQTKLLKVHPETLSHVKKIADQLEAKFKTQISHRSEPTPTVVVNGLCKQDTEDCWREIKTYIESNLIISEQIHVDRFQANYLETKHGREIQEMRQNCEVHFSSTNTEQSDTSQGQNLTITIKGYVRHVEVASERIKNLCSSYQTEMCQLEHPTSHFGIWKKRWKEHLSTSHLGLYIALLVWSLVICLYNLKRKCEEKFDLMFSFKHEPTPKGEGFTTPAVKERPLTQEKVQSVKGFTAPAVKERPLTQEKVQSVKGFTAPAVKERLLTQEEVQSVNGFTAPAVKERPLTQEQVQSVKGITAPAVKERPLTQEQVQSVKGFTAPAVKERPLTQEKVQSVKGFTAPAVKERLLTQEEVQSVNGFTAPAVKERPLTQEQVQSVKGITAPAAKERPLTQEQVQSLKGFTAPAAKERPLTQEQVQSVKGITAPAAKERPLTQEQVQSLKGFTAPAAKERPLTQEQVQSVKGITAPAAKERPLTQEQVQSLKGFTAPAVKERPLTQEQVQSVKGITTPAAKERPLTQEQVQSVKGFTAPAVKERTLTQEQVQSVKGFTAPAVKERPLTQEQVQSVKGFTAPAVKERPLTQEQVQSVKGFTAPAVKERPLTQEKVQSVKGFTAPAVKERPLTQEQVQSVKGFTAPAAKERPLTQEQVQSVKGITAPAVKERPLTQEKVQSLKGFTAPAAKERPLTQEKVQSVKGFTAPAAKERPLTQEQVQSVKGITAPAAKERPLTQEQVQSVKGFTAPAAKERPLTQEKVQSVKGFTAPAVKERPLTQEKVQSVKGFTAPAVKERPLTQEKVQSVKEKQIQLSNKEIATILTGLQTKELDLERKYSITLDIDRKSNLITLTAPTSARHDLVDAEKDIISFIIGKLMDVDVISPTQCEVPLHFQKETQPAIKLQGSKSDIQTVQQKTQSVFKQISPTVTDDELLVSPSFLPVFYKPDFIHFVSKLEEELCVACIYPKPRKVIREIVLKPPSFAHTLTFQICSGTLATEEVDAIVNPTSEDLLHHSDLAKAIANAGGPSIQSESTQYVQKHGKLSPGDAVCLGSGDLPCSHIIHTVKPQLKEANEKLLYFTVLNSLECARTHAICSIALPAIGVDVNGVPSYECAKTSMYAVGDFCQKHPEASVKTVKFMLFNAPTVFVFTKVFDSGIFTEQLLPAPSHTCSASLRVYDHWFWQNDQGHFSCFSQEVEKILTAEYKKSLKGHFRLQINGQHYEINFQTMTQRNMHTGFTREIRKQKSTGASAPSRTSCREVDEKQIVVSIRGPQDNLPEAKSRIKAKLKSLDITSHDILLPLMITSVQERQLKAIASHHNVGCDVQETTAPAAAKHTEPASQSRMVLRLEGHTKSLQKAAYEIYSQIKEFELVHDKVKGQYPPEWEKQTEIIEVFAIQPGTAEWNQVEKLFKSTMMNTKVTRIKRIQNKWLWEKYIQHKSRMNRKNDGRVRERQLFHGTSETQPEKIYQSEEGFDMRFSRIGRWGQANYFAVDAYYSDQYAYKRSDGQREMLLAKVLTGDSYCCKPDSSLRMPPLKYSGRETQLGQVRYDTITGYIRGSQVTVQVYMTYSNDKAYPAYLIRYYYTRRR